MIECIDMYVYYNTMEYKSFFIDQPTYDELYKLIKNSIITSYIFVVNFKLSVSQNNLFHKCLDNLLIGDISNIITEYYTGMYVRGDFFKQLYAERYVFYYLDDNSEQLDWEGMITQYSYNKKYNELGYLAEPRTIPMPCIDYISFWDFRWFFRQIVINAKGLDVIQSKN